MHNRDEKELRVLFLARKYPPSVGGMERFAHDLSCGLEKRTIIYKITWGGSNKWLPLILPYFFIRSVLKLATNRQIDIIHVQDALQAPIGWLLHIIFRKPYVIVAHGLDITFSKFGYQKLVVPFVNRANAVISISSATKKEVDKRRNNVNSSFMVTLGMNDDYKHPQPNRERLSELLQEDLRNKKIILTTGRLVRRKGVTWFIDNVMPALSRQDAGIIYLVVGEGEERNAIEAAIEKHKLKNQIKLLGRVSDEMRALLYQSSDLFLMPNIKVPNDMEGFGIVAQEAATAGLVVVASNMEGIADAIKNGKNGILVKSRDKLAFMNAVIKMLNNDKKRHQFGQQARKFTLENYSWDQIVDQYIKIYDQLLS